MNATVRILLQREAAQFRAHRSATLEDLTAAFARVHGLQADLDRLNKNIAAIEEELSK